MKNLLLTLCLLATAALQAAVSSNVARVVGADISLVPAYEAAGDIWLDASGNKINTKYSDGMITYLRDVAGLTAMRVRLIVDKDVDDSSATCQELDYVKKLGKRIKDAGMYFLLDIFYSDTWTDVSKQWIPSSWNMSKSTSTTDIAAKVKTYTADVLEELCNYGATPDYIQLGNEVSYGMLWDSYSGQTKTTHAFYSSATYSTYETQVKRFATILSAAAEAVRASAASSAKIVLHCERAISSSTTTSFYQWVVKAGFSDFDVIGLSYYPAWHGSISTLKGTLSALVSAYPSKEIQIVETGYYCNSSSDDASSTYCTWPCTPAGQASFLSDLITALNTYDNVTGLYYWQPEECGNGYTESSTNSCTGTNNVMDTWDNRGFWALAWQAGSHALNSSAALLTLQNFNHYTLDNLPDETTDDEEDDSTTKDITSLFPNLDLQSCEQVTDDSNNTYVSNESIGAWQFIDEDLGYNTLWPVAWNQWVSALCDNDYYLNVWAPKSSTLSAGDFAYQVGYNLPAGTYTLSADIHADTDGFYLMANDDLVAITNAGSNAWSTAYTISVSTTLAEAGTLKLGLTRTADVTLTSAEMCLYASDFTLTYEGEGSFDNISFTTSDSDADEEEDDEDDDEDDEEEDVGDEGTTGGTTGDDGTTGDEGTTGDDGETADLAALNAEYLNAMTYAYTAYSAATDATEKAAILTTIATYSSIDLTDAKALQEAIDALNAVIPTGINAPSATSAPVIYNLAGERVINPTSGIYIINGRKVVIP